MNRLKKSALFLFFWAAFLTIGPSLQPHPVFADNGNAATEEEESKNNSPLNWKITPGLGIHKPTYMLFTWTSFDAGRRKEELKFQISFKQRLFPWGGLSSEEEREKYILYFGYTQKSFWQVFDTDHSSPFRETNYNPELFVRTPEFEKWGVWSIEGGYEHESNGQDIPESRSWDRLYIRPKLKRGIFTADYKLWYRFEEDEKKNEHDTEGDDNPDIEDFYGNGELNFRIDFSKLKGRPGTTGNRFLCFDKSAINVMLRYNYSENRGAVQADYFLPLGNRFKLHFQYWNGYGESLIDYNRSFTKYGLGIVLIC